MITLAKGEKLEYRFRRFGNYTVTIISENMTINTDDGDCIVTETSESIFKFFPLASVISPTHTK